VITRALGTEADVDVDAFTVPVAPGDVYLLCSDGLSSMISDREILSVLAEADDLDEAARALIDAANEGGGEDNITVVLFAVDGDDDTATMPAVTAEQEHDDDEDTLSGLDAVPAVDTAVVPAAEIRDHLRRQEREPKRSLVPLLVLVVLLVVLVALAFWGLTR
jgi:protein phosphatase